MVYIIALGDDGKEKRVEVTRRAEVYRENLEVVVEADGKKESLGIQDLTVSRRKDEKPHLELVCRDKGYFIRDFGSLNGTLVDGSPLPGWGKNRASSELPVEPGHIIKLGRYTIIHLEAAKNAITVLPGDSMVLSKSLYEEIPEELIEAAFDHGPTKFVKFNEEARQGEYKGSRFVVVVKESAAKEQSDKRWIALFESEILKAKMAADKGDSKGTLTFLRPIIDEKIYGAKFRDLWKEDYEYMQARYEQIQHIGTVPDVVMKEISSKLEMLSHAIIEWGKVE